MGKPKFYDFCVHAVPDGDNTAPELAALARHFGYSGITLANHSDKLPQSWPVLSLPDGFEIFKGIELVEENPSKLNGLIGKFRKIRRCPDRAWRLGNCQQGCAGKSQSRYS